MSFTADFSSPTDNHKFDISAQSTGRPLPHPPPPPIHRRDHHPHRGCLCRSTENIIGHKVLGVKILINFTQDRPSSAPRSSLNMFESSIRSPVHSHPAACLTSLSIHQHSPSPAAPQRSNSCPPPTASTWYLVLRLTQ